MRHRQAAHLTDRATIERRVQTGENEIGEPLYGTETVASDVPCQLDAGGTSFVREDTGERVQRPARAVFSHDVDVQEGDTIRIDGVAYEARGITTARDHRRGTTAGITVELERDD